MGIGQLLLGHTIGIRLILIKSIAMNQQISNNFISKKKSPVHLYILKSLYKTVDIQ